MTWQDDYYVGSSDYPITGEDEATELDPWVDPAYERTEDVCDEDEA